MPTVESASPFVELGNRQLHRKRGYADYLEWMPQLRGRKQSELYREMEQNDALIGAILFAIEMLLRRVEWEVEPFGPEAYHVERADFLASCMQDLSQPWEEVVSQALTMLPYGFAYMEIVYKHRESAELKAPAEKRTRFPDGRVGWRKFSLIPQETIDDWELDDHGGVQAAWQGGLYNYERVRIPIDKALLFRTNTRTPRGTSILRRVVESWYYRKRIREVEGIGVERDLAGMPVMYVDADTLADATKKSEYQDIVRNLRRDEQEGVLLPATKEDDGRLEPIAKLELLNSGGERAFDTSKIIERYNREIMMCVLQDVVLLGHEIVGTQALASEKRDLSDTALQAWLNGIAATFNQHAVPRLLELNGESLEELPQIKPGELRPTDVLEFAEALQKAAAAGHVFDYGDATAEITRRLGLPPMPPEELEQREAERQAQQQAAMDAMRQLPGEQDDEEEEQEAA